MRNTARALLLLLIFAVPWEYSLELGAPIGNIARAIGLITLAVAVVACLRAGRIRSLGALQWLTIALYVWFCLSALWTSAPHETAAKLRGYAQEMMLVWLVCEFIETPDNIRNLMRAWLGGSWVLALLTLGSFVTSDPAAADQIRFAAIGQDPNDTARFLAFGAPIAVMLIDEKSGWFERVFALSYLPLASAAVMVTGSRSGFLIAILAFVGSGMVMFHRYPKQTLGVAAAVLVIGIGVSAALPSGTVERLQTITSQLQNGDLNQRLNIWTAGWRAFTDSPVWGHGAGSFAMAARLYPEDTAHNTVLAILVEGGVFALLLATGIVVVSIRSLLKAQGALRLGLGTLTVVWLTASMVNTVGENRMTWLLLGTIMAAGSIADGDEQFSPSEPIFYGKPVEDAG